MQSDIGDIYQQIKHLLEKSEKVLFVGTPCQCAGLLAFLESKPDDLILVDFICHGVNSPLVHQRYISEVEQELNIKVKQISHRDKTYGWDKFEFSIFDGVKNHLLGNQRQNPFLRGFLTNAYLRYSCFNCRFKGQVRPTDLTLGDNWGVNINDEKVKGVSIILVNSSIGKSLLLEIAKFICLESSSLVSVNANNPSMTLSSIDKYNIRDKFFDEWGKNSLNDVIRTFLD